MLIDQTKYAESVTNNLTSEKSDKAIENMIMPTTADGGFFAGKVEAFSKDKNARISESGTIDMSNMTYNRPGNSGDKDEKSIVDMVETDIEVAAKNRKNQMVVMSNTVSAEDYEKISKDGFSLEESSGATIISETDKIQAVLAAAGEDISNYGNGLSVEELEEITGNAALANQIMREMQKADLPITSSNIDESVKAYSQAASLKSLSDNAIAYMLENKLSPTIGNLYTATYSSQMTGNYYKASNLSNEDFKGMQKQIEEIITEAGLDISENTLEACNWLIKGGIGLDAANLKYYESLKNFSIDMNSPEDVGKTITAMLTAIREGGRPSDAILVDGYSLLDMAKSAMEVINHASENDLQYVIEQGQSLNIENLRTAEAVNNSKESAEIVYSSSVSIKIDIKMVTARRQLEEVRLSMTIEANYSMLKRGINIDTTDLEELVEELKLQEHEYYRSLLDDNGVATTSENVKTFADTTELIAALQGKPAYAMSLSTSYESITVLSNRATSLQVDFEKVNARYETMMTSPRLDMGDNIQKAFRNVDAILEDLNLELTLENQRAVRILAYNETEITAENIAKMKAVDEDVQRAFKNMTPAVTLEMIRQGKNPLDMSIQELNQTAVNIKQENGNDEIEKFSKYLWRLEQNKAISEEERSSYIGIYRLIAQVEKTDGAVIGSLINQGAEITMRNMLSAVRTNNRGKLDYKINDEFEGVNSSIQNERIDDQIMANYNLNIIHDVMDEITPEGVESLLDTDWENLTPEQLKSRLEENNSASVAQANEVADMEGEMSYEEDALLSLKEATSAPDIVYQMLESYDIPNSVSNVVAVARMLENPSQMFNDLFKDVREDMDEDLFDFSNIFETSAIADDIRMIREMKALILQRFGDAVKTPEDLAEAQETLAETATHAMDNMIMEEPNARSLDIKAMKLLCKQFSLAKDMAKSESYVIPVETSDGLVTGMSLKIIRGKDRKGLVDIFFNSDKMGKVAASFEAKDNSAISGIIATNDEDTRRILSENLRVFAEMLNENSEEYESLDLRVAYINDLSSEKIYKGTMEKESKAKSEGYEVTQVQTARLYNLAESFIKTIAEIG